MTDTTAHTHNMVDERPGPSLGQLNITFDGRTFTLPELVERVRNLESAQDQIVGGIGAIRPKSALSPGESMDEYEMRMFRDFGIRLPATTGEQVARDRHPAGKGLKSDPTKPYVYLGGHAFIDGGQA